MALSLTSIANYLFKRANSKSSTNDGRQFFEETFDGRAPVIPAQLWAQADQIPASAPSIADQVTQGVVKRYVQASLTAVPGTTNAFQSDSLRNCIPFNFASDGSYNYALFDSTGASIPFGQGDWLVDPAVGTVTFYGTVPGNMPPKISFYQYVGQTGMVSLNPSSLTFQQLSSAPAAPAAGYQTIFVLNDGKMRTIDSTGAVKALGSGGGGASGKNYLADYYDGSSVTGITQFNQNLNYTFPSNLVDTLGDTINYTACPFATGQAVTYTAGTTAIGGLTSGTLYWVVRIVGQPNIFGLATSIDNAQQKKLIDLTSQGAGTASIQSATTGVSSGVIGSAVGITQTVNTTNPLRNPSNLRLSKGAANWIGMGWSIPLTFDRADVDIARPMKLAFKLRTSSAYTSASTIEDAKVMLYDVDNQLVIPLDGAYLQPLPVALTATGVQFGFTPNAGGYNARFIVSIQNVNVNAFDLDFIDLEISAQSSTLGSFSTSFVNSGVNVIGATTTAPTKGTTSVDNIGYARMGDQALVKFEYRQTAAGALGSGDYLFTLPAGLSFDPSKVSFFSGVIGPNPFNTPVVLGAVMISDGVAQQPGVIMPYDATRFRIGGAFTLANGQGYGRGIVASNHFPLSGANISFAGQFHAPIAGWSSSATYSTQEIALKNTPTSQIVASQAPSTTNAVWSVLANTSITFQPGSYDLGGSIFFTNSGTSPSYNAVRHGWFGANGTGTGTPPAALSTLPGVTVFGIDPTSNPYAQHSLANTTDCFDPCMALTVKFTQPTTIFYCALIGATTPANSRIAMVLLANKRPDYSAFGVYGQVDVRTLTTGVINVQAVWVSPASTTITLPVGTWRVRVVPYFGNGTTNSNCAWSLASAPVSGGNLGASYLALSNITSVSAYPGTWAGGVFSSQNYGGQPYEVIFRVTTGLATLYGCVFQQSSANASNQVTLNLTAERLQ